MDLPDILGRDQIIPELRATDRWEAIDELIGILVATGKIRDIDREAVTLAVKKREQSMSTGIGFELAIPHADTDIADTLVMALGRSRNGVDFASPDKQPSYLVLLVLVPARLKKRFLQTLATFAKLFRNESLQGELRNAPDATGMFSVLNKGFQSLHIPPPFMDLAALLSPDQIILEMRATDSLEAIDELIDKLVTTGKIKAADRDAIADSVKQREKHAGTGFFFLAVPRCSCAMLQKPICAFGTSRKGIKFKGMSQEDQEPVKLVMLVLRPLDNKFDSLAIDICGSLIKACQFSPHLRESLEHCANADTAFSFLCEHVPINPVF